MNLCAFRGCVDTENVRPFKIVIGDGEPLLVQPEFCEKHIDYLLLRVGTVIGEMLLGKVAPL